MNNTLKYVLVSAVLTAGLSSCQDDWDDHYNKTADSAYGNVSLYEIMSEQPELSDFCQVLDATKTFANSKQTSVTYKTLLSGDQFFTVWAPVNGTFNRDSLLELCKTSEGDSLVELHFVKNHLARYSHSVNGKATSVYMLNGKFVQQDASSFGEIAFRKQNVAARNGLLHIVDKQVPYYYNIYEALVGLPYLQHIGKFFRSYQVDELDELQSLQKDVEDGKMVYIDSVFVSKNTLLTSDYDYINSEDSTFWMIVPTAELWDSLYEEAKSYYNYAFVEKADSIQERMAHYALLQDLIYNPVREWSIRDSIESIANYYRGYGYETNTYRYHTYYKPFEEGGLFRTPWVDTLECSNGVIYRTDQWMIDKNRTYFTPIRLESHGNIAKYEEGPNSTKKLTLEAWASYSDSVSGGAYLTVTPASQTDKYYVEYYLPNVLSGTYDVCVVFLPRSVNPNLPFSEDIVPDGKRNRRPSKFTAEISYYGTDGKPYTVDSKTRYEIDPTKPSYYVKTTNKSVSYFFDCNVNPDKTSRAFANNPFCVDTVKLCTMHFPTCNYGQKEVTNRLRLTNAITASETNTYWGVWFIDRILLLPHQEEENN